MKSTVVYHSKAWEVEKQKQEAESNKQSIASPHTFELGKNVIIIPEDSNINLSEILGGEPKEIFKMLERTFLVKKEVLQWIQQEKIDLNVLISKLVQEYFDKMMQKK